MDYQFLSPEEKGRVIRFNVDTATKNAVEKVLLYNIYNAEVLKPGKPAGVDLNWVYGIADPQKTDEEVGRMLKVKVEALKFLKYAWDEIEKYVAEVENKEDENPAV